MNKSTHSRNLRDDALAIWSAGVEAVKPSCLMAAKARVEGTRLRIEDAEIDFGSVRKLVVVGAGKASANMAIEFNRRVITNLRAALPTLEVAGWINCPEGAYAPGNDAGDIELFEARPAGRNEPTEKAVYGTVRILELLTGCDENDIVVCLLSGGGSALLAAPCSGVTLEDKQAVARLVAAAGGNIEQLNTVRRALSDVKGGGLARACGAGKMLTLVISDVLGDSLETIASGPTVLAASVSPQAALDTLDQLGLNREARLAPVISALRQKQEHTSPPAKCHVEHVILGNNADAVDAAGVKAVELGYRYVMECARGPEGDVLQVADRACDAVRLLLQDENVDCWISGGEPTVQLPKLVEPGKGGRNQQLVLAVLKQLAELGWPRELTGDLAFVSGGTDGEDGPTDAAGALFDPELLHRSRELGLDLQPFLSAANAYPFFEQTDGLILTGPTGTNVCDLRVAVSRA